MTASPPSVDAVYRSQQARWMRFLSRRWPRDVAEDVLQQSVVRVLARASETGTRIWRLDRYFFSVARNVDIDRARADRSRMDGEHVSLDFVEETSPADIPSADQIAALEARDMLARLEAVMQRMKPRTREIFLAHRIDGYTYGEIAARTGLSVKGVEKHMTSAIATIHRSMKSR